MIANVVNFVFEQNDSSETNIITSIILLVFGLLNLGLGIYIIVIACLDSERKTNKYGSSHKYGQHIQSSDHTQIITQIHSILSLFKMMSVIHNNLNMMLSHLMKVKIREQTR